MKYRVVIKEATIYEVEVEADNVDAARELALEEHQDGNSIEIDSGGMDVTDIEAI